MLVQLNYQGEIFTNSVSKSNLFFFYLIISEFFSSLFFEDLTKVTGIPSYSWFIVNEYGFILIPSLIFLAINKDLKYNVSLSPLKISSIALVTLIGFFAIFLNLPIAILSNDMYRNFIGTQMKPLYSLPYWQGLFIIAVTPAICEETAMRGVILSGYKSVDVKSAVMTNGFLFGMLHMNPNQFFYTFVGGMIFAYLVETTDSIFSSMIAHFLNNFMAFTVGYLMFSTKKPLKSSPHPLPHHFVISLIVNLLISMLMLFYIVLLFKKLRKISKKQPPVPTSIVLVKKATKTITWPLYASTLIFAGSMVFAQAIEKIHIFK